MLRFYIYHSTLNFFSYASLITPYNLLFFSNIFSITYTAYDSKLPLKFSLIILLVEKISSCKWVSEGLTLIFFLLGSAPFIMFFCSAKTMMIHSLKLSFLERSFNKVFSIARMLKLPSLECITEFLEKVLTLFNTLISLKFYTVDIGKIRISLISSSVSW